MKTLIVLESEHYIQPFMRAILNIAQEHYDEIKIITKPIRKGESINTDKIKHITITRGSTIIGTSIMPFRLFTGSSIKQAGEAIKKGKFNSGYIKNAISYQRTGMSYYLTALPYVKEALNKGEVHLLSCWFAVEAWTVARFKKHFPQIKAYSLAHSFEIDPLKNNLVDLTFNEWKHKYLDKIFFISNKMRDIYNTATQNKFVKKYGDQIEISYLGCTKMFDGLNPLKHSEKLRIVSCSYVRPEKRIDLIMEVLEKWSQCPVEWIHFGNGPLLEEMQKKATATMAANKNVTIDLKGYVSNEDVQKYYIAETVDLFINLSSSEGVPVSIMEAIAYGIPVAATDVGGVSEIIEDGHGLLIGSDDNATTIVNKLENFICSYKADPQAMRTAAYNFWKDKFNAETNYKKFLEKL